MVHYDATKCHVDAEVIITTAVASTWTVAPALPLQEHRLPLSNLDLLLPPIDVGVFFCYASGNGNDDDVPSALALKAALAKVLVPYYPLAGEVVATAAGEPELLCSGRGVDFTEAVGGSELKELRLGLVDEGVQRLVPAKKLAGVVSVQVVQWIYDHL